MAERIPPAAVAGTRQIRRLTAAAVRGDRGAEAFRAVNAQSEELAKRLSVLIRDDHQSADACRRHHEEDEDELRRPVHETV